MTIDRLFILLMLNLIMLSMISSFIIYHIVVADQNTQIIRHDIEDTKNSVTSQIKNNTIKVIGERS